IVEGDDVGMIQRRCGLRLLHETTLSLGIGNLVCRQNLQGDETIETCVSRLVNQTHPTFAKFLDDAVVRDGLAEHRRNAMTWGFASQRRWMVGGGSATITGLTTGQKKKQGER